MAEQMLGVEIVSPEAALFAGAAVGVVASTSEGDLAVMAGHAELIGDVVPGIVTIQLADGGTTDFVVHGGFLQVHSGVGAAAGLLEESTDGERTTRATILAGVAELGETIDVNRASLAKERAEARLAELLQSASRGGDETAQRDLMIEIAQAEADLARAELRLSSTHGR